MFQKVSKALAILLVAALCLLLANQPAGHGLVGITILAALGGSLVAVALVNGRRRSKS